MYYIYYVILLLNVLHSFTFHDCEIDDFELVPGTVSEGLNGWSEALTAGLTV